MELSKQNAKTYAKVCALEKYIVDTANAGGILSMPTTKPFNEKVSEKKAK